MSRTGAMVAALATAIVAAQACSSATSAPASTTAPKALGVTVAAAEARQVNRMLKVTGTLMAAEEAEVAAETAGRVTSTPVERGSRVAEGAPLVTLVQTEAQAGAADADANVSQLEARLAVTPGQPFDVEQVPEVLSAKASRELAEADFKRIESLLEQKVVSQAEFDQRRTQVEAARNQYRTVRNAALQQYRMLEGARARATLARKALSDTTVRSPFAGLVVERKVSVGDFVTRGTKIATVVVVSPLRVELTVPEQSAGFVKSGEPVRLTVDAFPGRYFEGLVRFISPAFRADQRALTVEAIVPNTDGALKPGMFVSADITLPASSASIVVPADAVRTVAGISHVFVIRGDKAEQRMVTPGITLGPVTEILKGVAAGEQVAVTQVAALSDGVAVQVTGHAAVAALAPARPAVK